MHSGHHDRDRIRPCGRGSDGEPHLERAEPFDRPTLSNGARRRVIRRRSFRVRRHSPGGAGWSCSGAVGSPGLISGIAPAIDPGSRPAPAAAGRYRDVREDRAPGTLAICRNPKASEPCASSQAILPGRSDSAGLFLSPGFAVPIPAIRSPESIVQSRPSSFSGESTIALPPGTPVRQCPVSCPPETRSINGYRLVRAVMKSCISLAIAVPIIIPRSTDDHPHQVGRAAMRIHSCRPHFRTRPP